MTNKYVGRCTKCEGVVDIGEGELIRVSGDWLVFHPECSGPPFFAKPKGMHKIHRSEAQGGRMYRRGDVLRTETGDIVFVMSRSYRLFRHTGMKHGVGRDEGYMYYADVRPASPKEVAQLLVWEAEMSRNSLSGANEDQRGDRDADGCDDCPGSGGPEGTHPFSFLGADRKEQQR
ncbi:MAG: hypothetical protein WCP21_17745 [Armatimonadota bacterium]